MNISFLSCNISPRLRSTVHSQDVATQNCKSLLFTSSLAERPINTPRYSKWATSQRHSHFEVAMTPLNVIQQSGHRPWILLSLGILVTAISTTFLQAYKRHDFSLAFSATRPSVINRSKLARNDSIATSITARRAIQQTSDDEASSTSLSYSAYSRP